jgi:hypothetical protein
MARYEFLAEHAIFRSDNFPDSMQEQVINRVVRNENEYSFLNKATLRTKAQILTTGLWIKVFDDTYKKQIELIKDGGKKADTGYPQLLNNSKKAFFNFDDFITISEKDILLPLSEESFLLQISLKLLSPFYSRDDLAFYPHENPLRREWVFHWPYLSAAGVKGLLRWAWRMCHQDDLLDKEELLFGPRKEEKDEDKRQQGCLYTYPIFWEGKVGLDLINPHSRENNTGTTPIKYEVVKKDAVGDMCILIFNRTMEREFLDTILSPLFEAIDFLLNDTAISAKRTAGWGAVKIDSAKVHLRCNFINEQSLPQEQQESEEKEIEELWQKVVKDGELLPLSNGVFTKKVLAKLSGLSPKNVNKVREKAYAKIQARWEEYKQKLAEKEKEPDVEIEKVKDIQLGSNIQGWIEKIIALNQTSVMEK